MQSTSIRMSGRQLEEIRRLGVQVGEFVREAVGNELVRRNSPAANARGPVRRGRHTYEEVRRSPLKGMSAEELIRLWPTEYIKGDPKHKLVVDTCNFLVQEGLRELDQHSAARKVMFVDPLEMGSLPSYENQGETHVVIAPSRHPEIHVSTGCDFVPPFEIARMIEIPLDQLGDDPDLTLQRATREAARMIAEQESLHLASLLDLATLPARRCGYLDFTNSFPDLARHGLKGCSIVGRICQHSQDVTHTLSGLLGRTFVDCPGVDPKVMHIVGPDIADQSVILIRQDLTIVPSYSNTTLGLVIFEEIGMGLFHRPDILTLDDRNLPNFVARIHGAP